MYMYYNFELAYLPLDSLARESLLVVTDDATCWARLLSTVHTQ